MATLKEMQRNIEWLRNTHRKVDIKALPRLRRQLFGLSYHDSPSGGVLDYCQECGPATPWPCTVIKVCNFVENGPHS